MILEGKKRIWKEYQKEIADDRYFYARSCIRQNFFPGAEKTFLRIMRDELGKEVYDDPKHTTCTGIAYHTDLIPLETIMTVVARQFSLMTESGYMNYVPSCITSFGIYTEILELWEHNPDLEEKARDFLYKSTGRTFDKPNNLAHASDIIFKFREEIAKISRHKLINHETGQPLRVVEHIGCHYARMFPHKGVGGAEYPYVLTGLAEAFGGEVVDYPERRTCCGFGFRQYLIQANRGYSIACSKKKFESMAPYNPDLIITNCPGCPYFLDRWQYVISEMEGKTYGKYGYGIPVLTFEELAGLMMGYNPWDIGLQMHQISVEPLLHKIGVAYDPQDKYCDAEGNFLGKPEIPELIKFH
jgi:heterodisulfide reductase subunit B1